jgi:Sulfotransferase domain
MKRLPDFIIIGAAKCGTTSLYKKLSLHPKVFMSTPKEPEFFARDDIFQKGLDWYAGLFDQANENQLCGEASTLYSQTTLFPETVARMHSAVPNVKLIYVLREPVDRTYSYYTQLVKNYQNSTRNFTVNRTFEECLFPENYPNRAGRERFFAAYDTHMPDDPKTLIEGSRYMVHIANYLAAFDKSQLLLVDFNDFIQKPDEVVTDICTFIGLNPNEMVDKENVRANISSEHFIHIDKEIVRQGIVGKVKNNPIGKKMYDLTPPFIRKAVLNLYTSLVRKKDDKSRPPKMDNETQSYLYALFKDEVEALEKFWQRDLSLWKQDR